MMDEWNRNRSLQPDPDVSDRDRKQESSEQRKTGEKRKKALDDKLDHALEDTFPGSDPVSITQPPHSAQDKHKP
jgi:hypothetical protein